MKKTTVLKVVVALLAVAVAAAATVVTVLLTADDEKELPNIVGHWAVVDETRRSIYLSKDGMFVAEMDPPWYTGYHLSFNDDHPGCRKARKYMLDGEDYQYCLVIFSPNNAAFLFSIRNENLRGRFTYDGIGTPVPWELEYIDAKEEP